MDDMDLILQYKQQGFFCSQILAKMILDLQGKSSPELIGAMHGLAGGLGFTGDICGTLVAGVALLGLYAGKGTPEQEDDPRLLFMVEDLVKWFKTTYGAQYGGILCDQIVGADGRFQSTRCGDIVAGTYQKIKELLVENGFDLSGTESAF